MSGKSVRSPNEEAFLKQISETRAAAASPEMPPSFIPQTPQTPDSTKPSARAGDDGPGGGGKGGSRGPGGGGGKGPDSSDKEPFFTREEYKIFMYIGLFLVLCVVFMFTQKFVADYLSSKQEQPQVIKAVTNSLLPKPSDVNESASVPDSKTVVYGSMFNCSTPEERDTGIANASIQQLGAGQSLHLTSGCALFQIETAVKKFDAEKYQLLVAVEDISGNNYRNDVYSGKYYKCGNTGGNTETVSLCREFLDKHRGKPVLVLIKNGGYANIN